MSNIATVIILLICTIVGGTLIYKFCSNKSLKKLYFLLYEILIISIAFIYISHNINILCFLFQNENIDKEWICNLLMNIGTGIMTSIGIIFFYDLIILREDKEEKKTRNQIALDALRDLLKSHFEIVLFGMYRASAKEEKAFDSLEHFFTDDYLTTIYNLDFYKSPFSDGEPKYCEIISEANDAFSKYLREEVIQFGQYLDPKILKLVREIRFSKFMKECASLKNMSKPFDEISIQGNVSPGEARRIYKEFFNLSPNGFPRNYHEDFYNGLKNHVLIFQKLVELYDEYTINEKLCNDLLRPNTGKVTTGCCRQDDAE